jgi:hypothetical protein
MTLPTAVDAYDKTDQLFRDDLEHYCAKLVQIQDKGGKLRPFIWNEPQRRLHKKIEKQLDSRGLVRAIVLKARRMGISTYVGARFYHRTTLWLGRRTFILTHEDKATATLFDMVKRMHENMPADYQPGTLAANEHELDFADQDSGYRVGTAKNITGLGRGSTVQLFHGSEVAFWARAESHFAGVMKAVSLVPDTEMILESTANGVGGEFYKQWGLAERGESDFIPIFLPWYIDPENSRPLDRDYEPSPEEEEYQRIFKLSDEQLCWAHFENINNCAGDPGTFSSTFKQENPATSVEAFQTTGVDSFIPNEAILRARRFKAPRQNYIPRVLGIDSARNLTGGDATRIVDRQGRRAGVISETLHTDDEVKIAHAVMQILQGNPDIRKAFFDITGGYGGGAHDICKANGFEKRVTAVNFGSTAMDPTQYANRRMEMWDRMRIWLLDPGGAQIPDEDEPHRHLSAPWLMPPDMNSRKRLAPKEKIKAKLGFSPDFGDALALTFAEIIPVDMPDERPKWQREMEDGDDASNDFMTT